MKSVAEYYRDPTPGDFEHRSGDCPKHGVNVPVARPYKGTGPYTCVACLLWAASVVYDKELASDD